MEPDSKVKLLKNKLDQQRNQSAGRFPMKSCYSQIGTPHSMPHHQQESPLKGIAEYGKIEQFLLTDNGGILHQSKRPAT